MMIPTRRETGAMQILTRYLAYFINEEGTSRDNRRFPEGESRNFRSYRADIHFYALTHPREAFIRDESDLLHHRAAAVAPNPLNSAG